MGYSEVRDRFISVEIAEVDFCAEEKVMQTPVIALLSSAGGMGKSTLCANLAFGLARKKKHRKPISVAIFDLDPQGALNLFSGNLERYESTSLAAVLNPDFTGIYPFKPCWEDRGVKVDLCQSDQKSLLVAYDKLAFHPRGAYRLADCLNDHPIPHDMIILDCPGSFGRASTLALTASTHILCSFQPESKSILAIGNLLTHYFDQCKTLRLNPYPEILGLIPTLFNKQRAAHRNILTQIPETLKELGFGYRVYNPIRFSSEIERSAGLGLPLAAYRSNHPAVQDFNRIVDDLFSLIKE
jgi:chromosome partitioning protein